MTGAVRVWVVPVDVPPEDAARYRDVLDDGERARAATYADPHDRRRFTVAHGALRVLAARELGTRPAALAWIPGRHGKPGLAPPWSGLHTSLSHSADMVVVAISIGRPVGIDIQHLVPGLDPVALAVRFFPAEEAGWVAAGPDRGARADRFSRLWVRKEAVVKAAGSRLWPNLKIAVRGCDVVSCAEPAGRYRVVDLPAPPDYRAAVALAGTTPFTLSATLWPGAAPALAS